MCWGKTLAWIQWQVGEHVKELRRDHPIASSMSSRGGAATKSRGNGDAFQRESPLRLPSRTPMPPRRRSRRKCADLRMPALAGEPDIGLVKVIGHVEASLFQLHSAYDRIQDAWAPDAEHYPAGGEVGDVCLLPRLGG